LSPLPVAPVNEVDMVLLPQGLKATAVKVFWGASSSEKKHLFREFLGKIRHC
jgi:transposase